MQKEEDKEHRTKNMERKEGKPKARIERRGKKKRIPEGKQ